MNNIWFTWGDVFNASFQNLWWGFMQFVPKLLIAIIFFIIGWVLGNLIAKAFEHVFTAMKIDSLLKSVRADEFMSRMGMKLNTGYFIGQVIRWFIVIVFLLPSLNLVGLDDVSVFLRTDVLGFLPRIVVAAFILIIASIVSDALSKGVMATAKSMNVHSANMVGAVVKYIVWVFAFIIAFGQLGIAAAYMQILFAGIIGMLAIAGALAFGLGAKDAAGRMISRMGDDMAHKD